MRLLEPERLHRREVPGRVRALQHERSLRRGDAADPIAPIGLWDVCLQPPLPQGSCHVERASADWPCWRQCRVCHADRLNSVCGSPGHAGLAADWRHWSAVLARQCTLLVCSCRSAVHV